jgi:hypothetical protein
LGSGPAAPCSVSERRPGARLARHQAQLAHQPADQLRAAQLAATGQHGMNAPVPVLAVIRFEQRPDLDFKNFGRDFQS